MSFLKKEIVIVGGGSCAVFLANLLDSQKFNVRVFEKNAAPARKFLVAGHGGLNLTHSEAPEIFVSRYTPVGFLKTAFRKYDNAVFRNWLSELGIETFSGTSGRVFPSGKIKPAQVLDRLVKKAEESGTRFFYGYDWKGFSDTGGLVFLKENKFIEIKAAKFVFCLGGASWPVTGSSGEWLDYFSSSGIVTHAFKASNCSFNTDWNRDLLNALQGLPLKNVSLSDGEIIRRGELTLTSGGIEGSGIYPFSATIRNQLEKNGVAILSLDLKPDLNTDQVLQKLLNVRSGQNITDILKSSLSLTKQQVTLLKGLLTKEDFISRKVLAQKIKSLEIRIISTGPVEDAISTVGGIDLNETDEHFQLKKKENVFVIGEMLDYDAPTGGYLLQSCYTMSAWLADFLNSA